MGWTGGVDRSTGDIVTAADWNDYMGAAGSLEYLYALSGSGGAIPTSAEASGVKTVISAASAGVKGAWVELIAVTAATSLHLILALKDAPYGGIELAYDIGIGAAASETVKIPDVIAGIAANWTSIGIPFSIVAGTRISARCANLTNGGAAVGGVSLVVLE